MRITGHEQLDGSENSFANIYVRIIGGLFLVLMVDFTHET